MTGLFLMFFARFAYFSVFSDSWKLSWAGLFILLNLQPHTPKEYSFFCDVALRLGSVTKRILLNKKTKYLTHAIIRVFELPPSESSNRRVIFESRNGTNCLFFKKKKKWKKKTPPKSIQKGKTLSLSLSSFYEKIGQANFVLFFCLNPRFEGSPRALITLPRARSPELMLMPSRRRSPTAPFYFLCFPIFFLLKTTFKTWNFFL